MLRLGVKATPMLRRCQQLFTSKRYLLSSPRPVWDATSGCGSLFSAKAFNYLNTHIEERTAAANAHLQDSIYENAAVLDIIRFTEQDVDHAAIHNNVGELVNTDFSYRSVCPGGKPLTEDMFLELQKHMKVPSLSALKEEFFKHALSHYGGGFVWLMQDTDPRNWAPGEQNIAKTELFIFNTFYGDSPLVFPGAKPLLCCNLWEHSYWTDFGPDRRAYLEAFWDNIDWTFVIQNLKAPFKIDLDQTGPLLDNAHHVEMYQASSRPLSAYLPPAPRDRAVFGANLEAQSFNAFHGLHGAAYQPTLGAADVAETQRLIESMDIGVTRLPEDGETLEQVLDESQPDLSSTTTATIQRDAQLSATNRVATAAIDDVELPNEDDVTDADHRAFYALMSDPASPLHSLPADQVHYFRKRWMGETTSEEGATAPDYDSVLSGDERLQQQTPRSPSSFPEIREALEKELYPQLGSWYKRHQPPPKLSTKAPLPVDSDFFELPSVQAELRKAIDAIAALDTPDSTAETVADISGERPVAVPTTQFPTLQEMIGNPQTIARAFDPMYNDNIQSQYIDEIDGEAALMDALDTSCPIQFDSIQSVLQVIDRVSRAATSGELEAIEKEVSDMVGDRINVKGKA